MKNKITLLTAFVINLFGLYSEIHSNSWGFYKQVPWILIPIAIIVTIYSQFWSLLKKKDNWGIKTGCHTFWLSIICVSISVTLYILFDPETGSLVWSIGMFMSFLGILAYISSCLSFWVGAFLKDKSTTISPTL